MTFSIVAFDKDANEVGFAIASCCWNAGFVCAAIAGKGAIAHQAQGSTAYHSIFFEQIDQKKSLVEILEYFREKDEHIENRQIGFVSIDEDSSLAFTGENCSYWAGHKTGKNYTCQGNILVSSEVVDAMANAFETAEGNLEDKLFAALLAGDKAGGDARGKQSARLHVKRKKNGKEHVVTEFNIMDHEEPIQEIERLLAIRNSYQKMISLNVKFKEAQTDEKRYSILKEGQKFLEDKKEARYLDYWSTIAYLYLEIGKTNDAIYCYRTILEIAPTMAKSIEIQAKKFNVPESVIKAVLKK